MAAALFTQAVQLWQQGRGAEAERLVQALCAAEPRHADAWRLGAEIAAARGDRDGAIAALERVATLEPADAANLRRLGEHYRLGGRPAQALACLERAVALEPDNPRGLNNVGQLLISLARAVEAVPWLERALGLSPDYAPARVNLGIALAQAGRWSEAVAAFRRAVDLQPTPVACEHLANALLHEGRAADALDVWGKADARRAPTAPELAARADRLLWFGQPRAALEACSRALALDGACAEALVCRIRSLLDAGDPAGGLSECERVLGARPAGAAPRGILGLRALALLDLNRALEALDAARLACQQEPGEVLALLALGRAETACGRAAQALATLERATELKPDLGPAHAARAVAFAALGRSIEALQCFEQAAASQPFDSHIFVQIGQYMLRLSREANAEAAFATALALRPDDPSALYGRATALGVLGRHAEAASLYAQALRQGMTTDYLPGTAFHARLQCCDWTDYEATRADIAAAVRRGERVEAPLAFLAHAESPADQLACARTYAADQFTVHQVVSRPPRPANSRLRIGYLSADFVDHPVGQLIAPVLEAHDRTRFEVVAFSAGPRSEGAQRRRLERSVEEFVEVGDLANLACAARIAERGIDIAVDLGGHTARNRLRVLGHRPAPLQVSFLGYPGTLGVDFIDYLVADRHVIGPGDDRHYAEHIIYLPDSYFPAGAPPPVARAVSRAEAGLPERGFVYCSFNAPFKLSPTMFRAWMRILSAVPDSVLWLRAASTAAAENLAREASGAGIDPARLVYAPRTATLSEHSARLSLAGLFLDSYPYNAHTTASDALGAGVPVLSLRGRTFTSRVATSLLEACGLPELSVDTLTAYEGMAIRIGRSPDLARALRARLLEPDATRRLFDAERFCRQIESAYTSIWARVQRGEPPSTLWV